ncbi:hypothetical protein AA0Z99_13550 [Agrococcus sp. 1P02AA]|uniref:DUF4190 domain-containing protein n=1 Tax=Agrococcus sp. 1P02AA TaxID=3132259 RepID=UPI0039A740B5
MPSDPDRFRPREHEARPQVDGARQQAAPSQHATRYASPPHAMPQRSAPPQYAPPQYAPFEGRDAPLIHPAAAQASNVMPYGVPVYQAPSYAYVAQPSRGLSITALVLGVCSLLFAWLLVVVPVLGVVFGLVALKREPAGRVLAMVGTVCSALGLLLVLLVYLLPFGAFFGAMLFGALA